MRAADLFVVLPLATFMPAVKTTSAPPSITSPSTGGRGPDRKKPTGGNGDGDFRNDPERQRGPRERLKLWRLCLAGLLGSSTMLFAVVTAMFFVRKHTFFFDPRTGTYTSDFRPIVLPDILWANTLLLVLSSLALEIARRRYVSEDLAMDEWLGISRPLLRRAVPWMYVGFLLSAAFIAGQIFVWRDLYAQGAFQGDYATSHFYLILSGLHAIHLLVGMVALLWGIVAAWMGRNLESRRIGADISAWYWHAITVIWIGVFALLRFFQ
jgi:cytochrome c oxidase subunit 3